MDTVFKIVFHLSFIILFAISSFIFIKAVITRLNLAFSGRDAHFHEDYKKHPNLGFRLSSVFDNVILQKKNYQEPIRGLMHTFIFYGFIVFSLHTVSQIVAGLFGFLMKDPYNFSLIASVLGSTIGHFYETIVHVISILVLIGLGYFAFRRWGQKAKGLDIPSPASAIIITMISTLMISTLFGEGAKLVSASYTEHSTQTIIATVFASIWSGIGITGKSADLVFQIMWWIHILSVFLFMIYVPTSKHSHLIFAPMNYFFVTDTPKGALPKTDLESENAVWGANKIEDFPWPSLIDGLACIECGRCMNQCPANRTGKVLSPKAIIVEMKHALLEKMPAIVTERAKAEGEAQEVDSAVIGSYISEEALWGCTTCYACVQACPVGNNQVNAIVEMRRHLVLAESRFPAELQGAFQNMENNSNPWGVGAHTRADWAIGLGVKTMADDPNVDILYWVGCAGAFDDRNKRVAQSIVKILQKANVNFAILGTEENCTGDSARRAGNEYLFQTMAAGNVELLNNYKVKKILTACPHCFNTIKNEYPQFGGDYEVVHHTEFIDQLIKEGKLELDVKDEMKKGRFTYHDSCYLGRYNDIYESPRNLIQKMGGNFSEASDHHTKSLCCGAGGAQMWMEEQNTDRINLKRTKQLLDTNADTIALGCPFCMTMVLDGVKEEGKQETVSVKDISEIIAENIK